MAHREPITAGKFYIVFIDKPIYETTDSFGDWEVCRVRDMYIDKAIKLGKNLVVQTPTAQSIFIPKEVKKTAKIFEQVFKFADRPMKLYELRVKKCEPKPIEAFMFM